MSRAAVLLDRDGTLVDPSYYSSRPEQLHLYEDIGLELYRLQRMGFLLVVVTNQPGIAQGDFDEVMVLRMHNYLRDELAKWDVYLDGIYYCPHHPDGVVEPFAVHCICRKPQPGMLLRAARELDIDLSRSWCVGDTLDDIEAGNRAACRTILVGFGTEMLPVRPLRDPTYVTGSTRQALQIIRSVAGESGSRRKGVLKRGISHVLQRQQKRPAFTSSAHMIYCPPAGQHSWNT
jgi:D-glycero-D-manno-heptose 1,7-bisphosphate phosphatase